MSDPSARLVFLHGFTQTHHHWHGPAAAIADAVGGAPTRAFVDLPGHGLAAADRTPIGDAAGAALAQLGGHGTWIGYSMGARFALHAALAPNHRIERLVLIGGSPGLEDAAERRARRVLDEERALAVERDGVDAFVEQWLALPMFAALPDDPRAAGQRRRNTVGGLASSLRLAGTGAQEPLWELLGAITMPVLVLAGAGDERFVDIGRRMAARIPDATFDAIAGAGHAAHIEQPAAVAGAVSRWIDATAT